MPLLDVVGNTGAVVFLQKGAIAVNAGAVLLLTFMVTDVVVAHKPAVGVKV
jgi:hypothetical protein